MLGIGVVVLIGAGALAMGMGGGGDDDAEMDVVEDTGSTDGEDITTEPLEISYTPPDDIDPETEERINAFLEELRNEPGLSLEDAMDRLDVFLDEIEAEADMPSPVPDVPATPEEDEDEVVRPPTGDEFADPLKNPIEPFPVTPQVPDEMEEDEMDEPLAPPPPPEDLVTVTSNTGSEFLDDVVLSDGPTSGEDADRDYVVSVGGVANDIVVDYDSQTTFLIEYSNSTNTIQASLNSDLRGPEPNTLENEIVRTDDNGVDYTQVTRVPVFADSASIVLNVGSQQIGEHVSQIDLTNPGDILNFNFGATTSDNLHLVFNEEELGLNGDTATARTAYVIATASSITSLTPSQIQSVFTNGGSDAQDLNLVAEIFLGEDSMTVTGDTQTGEDYRITITNFINDNPRITTNIEWTSIGEYDVTIPTSPVTPEEDEEDTPFSDDDDDDLIDLPFFNPIVLGT